MADVEGYLAEDQVQRWAAATYKIRGSALALADAVDPRRGSMLEYADKLYPWEKVSAWSRSYLTAGIEHMQLWADLVAPYEFDETQVNRVRFRPYLLIGRAGLEAGSHAVWLLADVQDPKDCVRRHLRLMYKDFEYQLKAYEAGGRPTDGITRRMETTVARAKDLGIGVSPKDKPPGYEKLIREAATTVGGNADRWSFLWNAASGAGHGQNWFGLVGYENAIGEEYEPGYYRSIQIPDAVFITETVEAAGDVILWGVCRWLMLAGYDGPAMIDAGLREVHDRMPKKSPEC